MLTHSQELELMGSRLGHTSILHLHIYAFLHVYTLLSLCVYVKVLSFNIYVCASVECIYVEVKYEVVAEMASHIS